MEDPVFAEDGHSYERAYIMQWLEHRNSSPLTRETIGETLTPNYALKKAIAEYHEACTKWEEEQRNSRPISVGSLPTFFNQNHSSNRMDNQSTSTPVSYTHLDVYKRQYFT